MHSGELADARGTEGRDVSRLQDMLQCNVQFWMIQCRRGVHVYKNRVGYLG